MKNKEIKEQKIINSNNLKKVEEYLKTDEAKEELKRIANKPIKKWPKPTWEQLNTPMDI